MIVDVLTLLDSSKQSGSPRDIGSASDPDESFSAIFEDKVKAEQVTSRKPQSDNGDGKANAQVVKEKPNEKIEEVSESRTVTAGAGETATDKTTSGANVEKTQNGPGAENRSGEQLTLTDEQLSKLAALLGISVEKLAGIKFLLEIGSGRLIAVMPDGSKKIIAQLSDPKGNGMPAEQQEAAAKLAALLGMEKKEAEMLFKQLRVSSIEIKSDGNSAAKTLTTGQVREQETQAAGKTFNKEIGGFLDGTEESGDTLEMDKMGKAPKRNNLAQGAETAAMDKMGKAPKQNNLAQGAETAAMDKVGKSTQQSNLAQGAETGALKEINTEKTVVTQSAETNKTAEGSGKTAENKVMGQIVEKVKILSFPRQTHARITLKPPSLGWVDIKIVMHETHARTVIVVESPAVKQMVEQNIDELKAALSQQGITVEEMDVSVEQQDARSFEQGDQWKENHPDAFNNPPGDEADAYADGATSLEEMLKAAYNSAFNITV
jgi:flagellar hook-length control protein FliK